MSFVLWILIIGVMNSGHLSAALGGGSSSSCVLPPLPRHGNYFISNSDGPIVPGNLVDTFTMLVFSCTDEDYQLSLSNPFSLCDENNNWTALPECHKNCDMPTSLTVDFECTEVKNEKINCRSKMPQGTHITSRCKDGHVSSKYLEELTCHGGVWNSSIPTCSPDQLSAALNEGKSSSCVLPPLPRHGNYFISNYDGPIVPGNLVDTFTMLVFSCTDEDYQLSLSNPFSLCDENNNWTALPECHKTCDMPTSLTVDFECRGVKNEKINCRAKMPQGTRITSRCKEGHVSSEYLEELACRGGAWNSNIPTCSPECGLQKLSSNLSLLEDRRDYLPWHIAIYEVNEGNMITHKCSGTLVTSNVIITTAHCFINPITKITLPAENFRVAVGKMYKEWNHREETMFNFIQKTKVSKIIIHEHIGRSRKDLVGHPAVLIVATPFKLSESVRPACFDLQNDKFNKIQTVEGSLGKVARWGRTGNASQSEALTSLTVPVVDLQKCQDDVSKKYASIVNEDRICAGDINGADVCEPGAGLVFPANDVTLQTRWYLRGFVNTRLFDYQRTEGCRKTYTVFTNIYRFKNRLFPLMHTLSKPRR